jgi:uncharacterized membrane protein YjgN (DUF898 family)
MRNEKEYQLSQETREVDHARRRLMVRVVIAFAILTVVGIIIFNGMTDALSTAEGRNGVKWTLITVGAVGGFLFAAYVIFAYTPLFKVMPKGEIYKPRNWGKSKKKLDRAA